MIKTFNLTSAVKSKRTSTLLIALLSALLLSSCSVKLADYTPKKNTFDIKEYFTGNIVARGILQDISNKVTRRFCVEIKGAWQENQGILAEKFYFHDGEMSYRNWQLTKKKDGTYTGTAEDVIGNAIGKHQGFAFQLQYNLLLKVKDSTYQVAMDDWMFQLDEYRVMNKTAISKFGINVANVTLFFDKQGPLKTCNTAVASKAI